MDRDNDGNPDIKIVIIDNYSNTGFKARVFDLFTEVGDQYKYVVPLLENRDKWNYTSHKHGDDKPVLLRYDLKKEEYEDVNRIERQNKKGR